MNRTCYTAVFGGFEDVWGPLRQDSDLKTLLVSDKGNSRSKWEFVHLAGTDHLTPRLANRNVKMLYFLSLGPEGSSVYIDANVRPVQSLKPLFEAFELSGADIGLYRHYRRGSVREEARACLARKKVDNPNAMKTELDLYEKFGFSDSEGLWEGSIIFKRHESPRLSAAMEEWWGLYSRFQTRDQFSLPFVIWKHGLKVYDLDLHSPGREHYFVRLQHSQHGWRNRTARYLQARAPENWFWKQLHSAARSLDSI